MWVRWPPFPRSFFGRGGSRLSYQKQAAFPDAQTADISVSLALLRSLHARWVTFWEQLPEESWGRTGVHQADGVVTLDDMLRNYAAHGEGHVDQITRTLAAATKNRG